MVYPRIANAGDNAKQFETLNNKYTENLQETPLPIVILNIDDVKLSSSPDPKLTNGISACLLSISDLENPVVFINKNLTFKPNYTNVFQTYYWVRIAESVLRGYESTSRNETREILASFEQLYGFPQVVGAVDGCHKRIKAPFKNSEDYINRKEYHSIILQGLADSKYLIKDIFVGWTGKSHNSRVLIKNSSKMSFHEQELKSDVT
ncbi:uncharacterized protein LOC136082524 [Hydra vulgaris]|uniref:Uncharacterized protein LOC136082524 n=1 Tax=Hydra vulgaris TaxID=6087 RepID=A0ABM4C8Q2_HYDVU